MNRFCPKTRRETTNKKYKKKEDWKRQNNKKFAILSFLFHPLSDSIFVSLVSYRWSRLWVTVSTVTELRGLFVTLIRRFLRAMRTRVRWQLVDDEIDSKAKPTTWRRYRRGKTPMRIHHEDSPRARTSSSSFGCSRCWKKINIAPPFSHYQPYFVRFSSNLPSFLSSSISSWYFLFSSPFRFFLILFYSFSLSLSLSFPVSLLLPRFSSLLLHFFPGGFFFVLIRLTIITVETKRTTNASRILLVFLLQRSVAFNQMTQRTGMIAFNGD